MKLHRVYIGAFTCVAFIAAGILAADAQPAGTAATTPPVYVPDISHANDPMPDGVFAWDHLMGSTNVPSDQQQAHFVFNFTNIAQKADLGLATNITSITNLTTVTNSSFWARLWGKQITPVETIARSTNVVTVTNSFAPAPVAIVNVHPSCGCTTAQLPPLPWIIAPGTNGQIPITVNIAGRPGTIYKYVDVSTDRGTKRINLSITILPPVVATLSDKDREAGLAAARIDRQAVFRNDCATCHVKPGEGKYGQALYNAVCAVCHEAEHRATMVPDLHTLKVYTNDDFWRTWITHGKPGSFMPAFSTTEGGPLSDMQIDSLVAYLNQAMPALVPPPAQ